MEFFRLRMTIPFMRFSVFFNVFSVFVFAISVYFLWTKGLNLSTEFTGGTIIEVRYSSSVDISSIRNSLIKEGLKETFVQNYGSSRDVLIRLSGKDVSTLGIFSGARLDVDKFSNNILSSAGSNPVIKRAEFVGPQVGSDLARDGMMAIVLVCVGIVSYLAFRFEWRFALSAIIANLHDVVIILGFFSFFQWEFSLSVLAAVLAVLGYSVNESVVIFDRVRETFINYRHLTTSRVIDHAITSTLSRTVITHLCTQMMVTSMLFFGGGAIHNFALALTIGICFGIYSSVLVSSPLLMWFGVSKDQFVVKKVVDRNDANAGAIV
ncbi:MULTISPECIES: protein translocase subunit SecF [Candidatus Ichthyocystis]|uniref:Protein-export membrane protein SecF n=1 Tax=Candidatus Ichthyocystis hellenicum TaxID=1561003 RepID=A0A0S4M2M8_9BURK|nr:MULTISPECIES: protein translocase subunit SecF [Ichthyocystis]CUT18025.1 preprotein translocase subunit SecF [Candidatus Ichthyocystis hellenicum]